MSTRRARVAAPAESETIATVERAGADDMRAAPGGTGVGGTAEIPPELRAVRDGDAAWPVPSVEGEAVGERAVRPDLVDLDSVLDVGCIGTEPDGDLVQGVAGHVEDARRRSSRGRFFSAEERDLQL